MHPHIGPNQWHRWFAAGHILLGDDPVSGDQIVRGGEQYRHLFPDTVEPDVDAGIEILWEDSFLVAVHKPAPLPMHPCGRFNHNTLISMLRLVYQADDLHVVHRLDANTTGIVILARTRIAANHLRNQFDAASIDKRYVVRCEGHPPEDFFLRDDSITRQRGRAGSRSACDCGHSAVTRFEVIERNGNGTSLLWATPTTGRTNQIRIHLWAMGMPVVGDPVYLKNNQLASRQTLTVDEPPMCLHAAELVLNHPESGRRLKLVARDAEWIASSLLRDVISTT